MNIEEKIRRQEEISVYFPKPEWLEEAITKYFEKLEFTILRQKLEKVKPKMDEKSVFAQVTIATIQDKVRLICDKYGLAREWYPHYMTFALRLYKIMKKFHPSIHPWKQDYIRELKILAITWTYRGLNKEILKEIAKTLACNEMVEILDQI